MPESEMYKKSMSRDEIVNRYGEATVSRAEVSVILNLLYLTGIVRPNEFVDAMVMQCERIENERRAAAKLDVDKG